MRFRLATLVSFSAVSLLLAVSGCKPTYPACESDEHCAEKNEVCLNQQCQECRDDTQCDAKHEGSTHECLSGRCEVKPECRTDAECSDAGEGMVCRSNKCVPECTTTEDCPSGEVCESSRCVATGCVTDQECGAGMSCVEGDCVVASAENISSACRSMNPGSGDSIALGTVQFGFNDYDLTVNARSILDQNAECLQEDTTVTLVLEGHCDERGTQEYNLALGEKRANAVKSYLRNLGVDTSRLRTRSKGENEPVCNSDSESCFEQNRRVEFLQSR